MASAIAMIMAFVQVLIVVALLGHKGHADRGPAGGGKG
jgi:putative spermidine/putrescine transport system permease protein